MLWGRPNCVLLFAASIPLRRPWKTWHVRKSKRSQSVEIAIFCRFQRNPPIFYRPSQALAAAIIRRLKGQLAGDQLTDDEIIDKIRAEVGALDENLAL